MLADMLLLKPCNAVAENQTASSRFPETAIRKIFQNLCTEAYGSVRAWVCEVQLYKGNEFTEMFGTDKKAEKRYLS